MTDLDLTRALERGEIVNENFHHASHLHVAWVYLSESSSVSEAAAKMRATLRRFTAAAGKPEKYHETITLFWVHVLATLHVDRSGKPLEQVVATSPRLLEKDFPLAYYSSTLLFSNKARTSWIEPDLKPLPIDASEFCSSSSSGHPSHRPLS